MAMMRYSSAIIAEPSITPEIWTKTVCCGHKGSCECGGKTCRVKVARTVLAKYDPQKYLLSHCSIMAAVDTELACSNDPKSDYYIHPAYSKFVNNNGDAWSKKMLAASYKTFVGANNFLEHVQISELSKGKVVDAVLREVPIGKDKTGKDLTTYYVDILVATDRKHRDLIARIESGQLSTLSMGCFLEGTEITLANGLKTSIENVKQGDLVLTHKGNVKPVMHTQKTWYEGPVYALQIEGDYKTTYVTPEHPFWAFKKEKICACGCGEKIDVTLRGDKLEDGIPSYGRFKPGHFARVINPNSKTYSLEDYKRLRDENSITEKMSLNWIEAKDLKIEDIISYPISDICIESKDATIEKARLIGYFLAEGSFVKEVFVTGEENDLGVRCRICGGIYNKIGTHIRIHKMKTAEYKGLYPDAPLDAKIAKSLIRSSRKEDIKGLLKDRKKVGAEFSLGEHEYETVNKEIADLAKIVFPNSNVLRYKNAVKIIGEDVAKFFEHYCGEYFDNKILPQEVMYWDKKIQSHIVSTWIIGDLHTTGSKNLASQLRFMCNRLRVMHNLYKLEERAYKTDLKKMTADGTEISQHYEGIRSESYMIQINLQGFTALQNTLNYSFDWKIPSRFDSVSERGANLVTRTWKNSHKLDNILRPIKSKEEIDYKGWVYNFGVSEDDSYIANDMAVHNCKISFSICTKCGNKAVDETQACQHVKYEKNNSFYDENGTQRRVAELCGHHEEPDSVSFVDASWVANPAFTGAVVRNIVSPPENIMAKIQEAEKKDAYEYKEGDLLKAAHDKKAQAPVIEEGGPAEAPPEEPKTPEDTPPAEEPASEEAPAEEPAVPEMPEEDPIKTWKKQIKQQILQELGNDILKEFSGESEEEGIPRPTETYDESLIQPTASIALKQMWKMKKGWDRYLQKKAGHLDPKSYERLKYGSYMLLTSNDISVLKDYGYNRRDFLAILSFIDECFRKPLSKNIKMAIAELGGTQNRAPKELIFALQKIAGKKLSVEELNKSLMWLKAMDKYSLTI